MVYNEPFGATDYDWLFFAISCGNQMHFLG